jgi:hypothetical protein
MSTVFIPGDLLLYFNSEVVHIVLLDEVDEHHFTIVTSDDGTYQYGYKIRIKNLTGKYFLKLDTGFNVKGGVWETYEDTPQFFPQILKNYSENFNTTSSV